MSRIAPETELARIDNGELAQTFTREKVELLKRTICKGANDDELELFIHACKRTGLDPFMKQVYALKRWQNGKEVMTIQTGIDGYRLIAERSDRYMPGREPTFEYDAEKRLVKATAYVQKLDKLGKWHEIAASAHFDEYAGLTKDGSLNTMWRTKSHVMLAKCAEALALRRAFPAELSGVYTAEEMDQAGPAIDHPDPKPVDVKIVAGEPDLADDATFGEEWRKVAKARNINPIVATDFLNAMANLPRHKEHAASPKWRADMLATFTSGKMDDAILKRGKFAPKPADEGDGCSDQPENSGADPDAVTAATKSAVAAHDANANAAKVAADASAREKQSRVDEAKRILAEVENSAKKPATSRPINESDMTDLNDFWFLMSELPTMQNHGMEDVKRAVTRFASGTKKTPETMPPVMRFRVYSAAKAGQFAVPAGTIATAQPVQATRVEPDDDPGF